MARAPSFWWTNSVANPVLARVLRTRAGTRLGRRFALIDYGGRRSGRARELVTRYERDGDTVVIEVGTPEHKWWWRNFRHPYPMHLRLAGQEVAAVAHAVTDADGTVRVVAEIEPWYATSRSSGRRQARS